jgi:hypothetical protein
MLAPTAVEEVAGAAVGETMATVTPETMAEFSSAFEQIMGDTAVDDLSGYTVVEVPSIPAPNATGITASGNTTAAPRAAIVNATPAVLTPLPIAIGNTTSWLIPGYRNS